MRLDGQLPAPSSAAESAHVSHSNFPKSTVYLNPFIDFTGFRFAHD